jgi:hypothetical protein
VAHQQLQWLCNRCGRPTLHARNTEDVPHVLYLLLTLFCCGLVLPIWILHAIIAAMGKGPPFLCQVCGQPAGQRTPEQEAAWHAALARDRAMREQQRAAEKAQRAASLRETLARWRGSAERAGVAMVAGLRGLPGQTNRVLLAMAGGEENMIVYRFLQVLVGGLFFGSMGLLLFLFGALVARVVAW